MPLACVAVRESIRHWFDSHPLGWGATYHAHPVALACGYEVVKHMLKADVVPHVRSLEPTMIAQLQRIVDEHPSVRQARAVGLFGCLDLVRPDRQLLQRLQGPPAPEAAVLKAAMRDEGLVGLFRPPHLHCAPPLIITEPELLDGFERLDRALSVLDRHMGL
jgi:taurine--2-oxoglutarate transaminase